MKKCLRITLLVLLLAVFAYSTSRLVKQYADNSGGSDAYASALAIASGSTEKPVTEETLPVETVQPLWVPAPVEDDPHMEEMAQIDLAALREINPDVLGWIRIPDSRIDYPLMAGTDNDFYLNHTWDKQENSVGSIFLEHQNSPDLTDYNTILYGHNMNDGSMFAGLRRYTGQHYWSNHPYVYIATDSGVLRYEIFSSYTARVDSVTYGLSFRQEKTRADFLIHALETSVIQADIVPEKEDRILTLSTCSGAGYSTRWVVHARLKMVQASETA